MRWACTALLVCLTLRTSLRNDVEPMAALPEAANARTTPAARMDVHVFTVLSFAQLRSLHAIARAKETAARQRAGRAVVNDGKTRGRANRFFATIAHVIRFIYLADGNELTSHADLRVRTSVHARGRRR